ncbi:MAG: NAD(P)/FAD-dependent oxidoreductase [Proteobacteria bacterium]|nr:NAD(P)/FAD-dependent oxidoreductase [Desulfobulbaceae bacterium]MBU4153549.1 NAD(P)/FAD-dependent oxidoreductase [Pseudomonadota bacterium]MDP2106571.1 NAD(P)/FAD-dependent oxidoreductase [Desulfobulbaceae bacterium]
MSEMEPEGSILQRDKKTFAIVPRTPLGMVSADALEAIAAVVRKYKIPVVKITSGQRLALIGLEQDQLEPAWQDLGIDIGYAHTSALCLHYVQACPGNSVCKFGLDDSLGVGTELDQALSGLTFPAKIKVGVSGCPMCCGESFLRDVGLFAKSKGWTVVVGGNAGGRPRIADILQSDLNREEAVKLIMKFLQYYQVEGKPRERSARFLQRVGIDAVKQAVCGE